MNVSLTPELEQLINDKVASGMYHSASEVVREGLRLLREQDELRRVRLEELRREVMIGKQQIERGESKTFGSGAEVLEEIKRGGRERLPARARNAADEGDGGSRQRRERKRA